MSYDNPKLFNLLKAKGYTIVSMAKLLGIAHQRLKTVLNHPLEHLTIRQYMLIAFALELPLPDVLFMALDINTLKAELSAKWFEEGLDSFPYFCLKDHPNSSK